MVARLTAGLAESNGSHRRVCDSRHLQPDCQEPGSAPEPYARQSSMGYIYLFTFAVWWCIDASGEGRWYGGRRQCSRGVRRAADSPRGSTVEEEERAKCDVYVWWCIDASGEGRWYGGRRQCWGGDRRAADSPRGSTVEEE